MIGLGIKNDQPPNTLQPKLVDGVHLRWAFKRELGFPWYGYSLFRRNHGQGDPVYLSTPLINLPIIQPIGTVLTVPIGPSFDALISSDSDILLDERFPYQHTSSVPVLRHPEFSLRPGSYLRFTFPAEEPARWVRVYIGFTGPQAEIQVTGLYKGRRVAIETIAGKQGDIKTIELEYNAISAIELSPGPASLIDLGFVPVSQDASAHWVPLFTPALCLPVAHLNYPCSGAPVSKANAETMALSRIHYGLPEDWRGQNFTSLFDQLVEMVKGGPLSTTTMAQQKGLSIQGTPTSPSSGATPPTLTGQYPLNLILLGALHPAIAQMVGLYWVDETAQDDVLYDYLLVANYSQASWTLADGFDDVDAFIAFNLKKTAASPLSAPTELHTFALPSAENTVGLHWDVAVPNLASLEINRLLMYHLWRAGLGNDENPTATGTYNLITPNSPVLIVDPVASGKEVKRPTDWPPDRLDYLDSGLVDGWYSYQVSGIDVFGRHSPNSSPGPWYQWTPAPDPEPWYYKKPSPTDSIVHPSAVRVLDTLPPPPPTGIEAYALDPQDPTVLKDAAYTTWWNALTASSWYQALAANDKKNLIGLRVRWQWTHMQMKQAPDTQEFRIYYHPDPMNVLMGKITEITTAADPKESTVKTDISNSLPADAYKGLWLQVGNDAFKVVSSEAGSPLHLTVSNIGPQDDIQPTTNTPCLLVIPEGNQNFEDPLQDPHFVDYSVATNWKERYYVVDYGAHYRQLSGAAAVVSGTQVSLDGTPNLANGQLVGELLFLASDTNRTDRTYTITAVDNVAKTVMVDAPPNTGGNPSAWNISFRTYEVFLPTADGTFKSSLPLVTSLAEPIKYAHVSVSAADDKTYTKDRRTTGNWANLTGNEGPVGARAKIFRVRREPPPAPEIPLFDSDKVYATPANYNSRSFYTFRWVPITGVTTHIFRALDESVFQADWSWRSTPFVLSATNPNHLQKYFPAELRKNDAATIARRNDVVNKLNGLNNISRAASPEVVRAAYRALTNDALRVLAGLPGSDRAFNQLTIQQLDPQEIDPDDSSLLRWRDRIGPDNPTSYIEDALLRSYLDTLDGRSTNCYFYRAGSVDGAHNRSEELSLSTPAVYCPDVTSPRTPVITKVFAGDPDPALSGDGKITLQWASNRELDLKEYHIYRSDNKDAARDLRLMILVRTEPETRSPAARPAQIIWTDKPVAGGTIYFYRLVAVDKADNISIPSGSVAGQAYDYGPPVEPTWIRSEWIKLDAGGNEHLWTDTGLDLKPAIVFRFASAQANVAAIIQQQSNGSWLAATPWIRQPTFDEGTRVWLYTAYDHRANPGAQQTYRAKLMSSAGIPLESTILRIVSIP